MGTLALSCIFFTLLLSTFLSSCAAGDHQVEWLPACTGTVAECLAVDGEEFSMDTEISRRILATSQYISYQALRRNSVPCSRRGASYYNCRAGAQANPYSRGCSAITRCRG